MHLKLSAAASTRHSGHSPLLLARSSLPFASLQTPKMPRGSFDQALWPQAYAPKTLRGSFNQALRPQPSVVKGVQACRLAGFKP